MDVRANYKLTVRFEPSYDVPGLFEFEAYFTTAEDAEMYAELVGLSRRNGEDVTVEWEEL